MSNSGLQQVFMDQITDSDGTKVNELGSERWKDGNKYRYVYNSSGSNAVDQQAVAYVSTNDFAITPTTVADKPIAGVLETAIATLNYGWMAVEGFVDATCTGTITAGDVLAVNGTGGVLTDSSTFSVGYATADATSNVVKAYINL